MAKSFPNTGVTTGLSTDRTALTSTFKGQYFFETDTNKTFVCSNTVGPIWTEINDLDNYGAYVTIEGGSAQTGIVSDTWTALTFASATVTNPFNFTVSSGAITIPTGFGGLYNVFGQVQWDSNATGGRGGSISTATPSASAKEVRLGSVNAVAYGVNSGSGLLRLADGDVIKFYALQSSGANRATEISFLVPKFSIARLCSL